ncbi:MAG: hypothetical protein RBU26_11735, partial [Sphaerochaeta sp.]|uniref:hypothetical protein n=1 Tax=Sphaerochaeta sp. TaxID=1972642 RepID=UPI002A35C2F0
MEHSGEYFKNSPWGNLSLDRTFLSYNTLPLVFSLLDTMGNHYLSICVSWHPDYEWLVIQTTAAELISLINDSTEFYECEQFPMGILPQKDVYLELDQDDFREYVLRLQ